MHTTTFKEAHVPSKRRPASNAEFCQIPREFAEELQRSDKSAHCQFPLSHSAGTLSRSTFYFCVNSTKFVAPAFADALTPHRLERAKVPPSRGCTISCAKSGEAAVRPSL